MSYDDSIQMLLRAIPTAQTFAPLARKETERLEVDAAPACTDVTALSMAALRDQNERLVQENRELAAAQAQLVQAQLDASLGRLVAGLLHEINTPLGALRSATDASMTLMRRFADEPSPRAERLDRAMKSADELASVLVASAERISGVVDNLRRFSNLDAATFKTVDARTVVEGALALLAGDFEQIDVERELGEAPARVFCNSAKLSRAVYALLLNAVEAMNGSGRLRVTLAAEGDEVVIHVIDDGRGMTVEQVAGAFELGFARQKGRVKLQLGLPTSRRIVEEVGGRIAIRSEPGEGTDVELRLPLLTHG